MKITIRKVQDAVRRLDKQQVNPTTVSGMACVYTSPADPGHHCIAGEILYKLGAALPRADHPDNTRGIDELIGDGFFASQNVEFTPGAASLLKRLQMTADQRSWFRADPASRQRRFFGKVVEDIKGARR